MARKQRIGRLKDAVQRQLSSARERVVNLQRQAGDMISREAKKAYEVLRDRSVRAGESVKAKVLQIGGFAKNSAGKLQNLLTVSNVCTGVEVVNTFAPTPAGTAIECGCITKLAYDKLSAPKGKQKTRRRR